MRGNTLFIFTTGLLILLSIYTQGQQLENTRTKLDYQIELHPASEKISIDGDLSEAIWRTLTPANDFWICYPVDDQKVDEKYQTEVRMTYDDQFIYLGITCYSDPDYIIQTLKRDDGLPQSDGVAVVIDPVNEQTNGFVFGVTAAGAQTEMLITGQTGRRDQNGPSGVSGAWDNKWFSEVKNYEDQWTVEMAIPFKSLRFKTDIKTWGINFFRFHPKTNSVHSWTQVPLEFWELDLGYTGNMHWEKPPKRVKSNISVIPYALGGTTKDFQDETAGTQNNFEAGVDAKVALTSSLNFDLTINPDFSQVDVDEQVTNLSLFDIRFPERRLFFLENSDVFEDFGIPPMRPFFSRKIGLDDEGNTIPILYGARLSGNVNNDLRIGLMNLQTKKTDEYLSQNYTAFAFHQKVFSRSIIKGYFHNRNAFDAPVKDYNRNTGLEFQYRSSDGRTRIFGGGGNSFTSGIKGKSYFYNLGAGYDNKNISVYTNIAGVGSNYVADMGFLRGQEYYDAERDTSIRIGYNHWFSRFSYTFYPKTKAIISHVLGARYILDLDSAGTNLNNDGSINYALNFTNTSQLNASYNHTTVNLLYPFSFINEAILPAGYYTNDIVELGYDSDQRKRFIFGFGFLYGNFFSGKRTRYFASLKYRAQPWGNFSVNVEQNNLKFPEPYGQDIFLLISPKIEINFSRSLFWTTFLQYNTQKDNFNINSRLQWRFLPMSDVYLVYTDNYAVEYWGPKNRGLVLKVNYWLNL